MQKYYFAFKEETVQIISLYNMFAPLVLFLFFKYTYTRNGVLQQKKINSTWVDLLFFVGVFANLLFFVTARGIPLFANDAENFRVEAVSGRGFLVVIADSCFEISVLLTEKDNKRNIRTFLAVLLLLGTGYRSQALTIILLVFITYWIGKGRRYVASATVVVVVLGALYSLVGVTRSGIGWRWQTLYMPAVWRLYVNSNNFNQIVQSFPKDKLLYGSSFLMDLSILLPGAQKSFMLQLKEMLGLVYAGGSFTPGVFGEAYADFGRVGAVIWPLMMLVIILFIDKYLRKRVDGHVYYVLAFCLAGPSTSSFLSSMLMGFLPKLLVYFTLEYLSIKKPITFQRRTLNGIPRDV